MYCYFFVWDRQTNTWPVRYWVTDRPDVGQPPDLDILDGVITPAESELSLDELWDRWPEPRYRIGEMSATSWQTVEDNYPGMSRD